MKVARLIIYEGEAQQVADMLGRSQPDGVHSTGGRGIIPTLPGSTTMTIITLPEMFVAALEMIGTDLVQRIAEKHEGKFVEPTPDESQKYAQQAFQSAQARPIGGSGVSSSIAKLGQTLGRAGAAVATIAGIVGPDPMPPTGKRP